MYNVDYIPSIGSYSYVDCDIKETTDYLNNMKKTLSRNLRANLSYCFCSATGTGKSCSISYLLKEMRKRKEDLSSLLILAPSKDNRDSLISNSMFNEDYNIYEYEMSSNRYSSIFMTYSLLVSICSSDEIFDLLKYRKIKYIVLDEAHQAGADCWELAVKRLIDCCDNPFVLGLSPVEMRTGTGECMSHRDYISRLFNGKLERGLTLDKAFNRGILPVPDLYTCYSDKEYLISSLRESLSKKSIKKSDIEVILRKRTDLVADSLLDNHLVMASEKHDWDKKEHLCFLVHSLSKENCTRDAEVLRNKLGSSLGVHSSDIEIIVYNSDTACSDKKKSVLQEQIFNPEKRVTIVAGVNMLNSSIHWKCIDAQFIFRHTQSMLVALQTLGRQERMFYDKQPVIFDISEMFIYDNAIQLKTGKTVSRAGNNGIPIEDAELLSFMANSNNNSSKILMNFVDDTERMNKLVDSKLRRAILKEFNRTLATKRGKVWLDNTANKYGLDSSIVRNIIVSYGSI